MLKRLKEFYIKNKTAIGYALISLPFGLSFMFLLLANIYGSFYGDLSFLTTNNIIFSSLLLGIVLSSLIGVLIQNRFSKAKSDEKVKMMKLVAAIVLLILGFIFIEIFLTQSASR